MKIKNATHWNTAQLKAIATRVAKDELDPEKRKHYTVTIKYGHRSPYCSGRAPLGGYRCLVRVSSVTIDRTDFAGVLAHEMAHSRGMKHAQMRNSSRYRRVGRYREIYSWAESMPLEKQAPPKTSSRLGADAKLERAQTKLTEWQRKIRLAQNRARKWQQRVRYYERQIKKAAQGKGEP